MKTKMLLMLLLLSFIIPCNSNFAQTFEDDCISFVLTEEGDDEMIQRLVNAGCTNLYEALIYLRNNIGGSAPVILTEKTDALIDTLNGLYPNGEVFTASLADFTGGNSPVGINSDGTFVIANFSIYDYDGHPGYARYTGDEIFTYAINPTYYIYMRSNIFDLGGGATLEINYKAFAVAWDDEGTPVELTSFTANQINNAVELTWQTATETNNSGFSIERSLNLRGLGSDDGNSNLGSFVSIGFTKGNGTTTEPQNYSFTDKNIENGNYRYRLKQIDYDGTYEYSNIIEVTCNVLPSTFELFQNYPNPFNPSTVISFQLPVLSKTQIQIFNVLGREVATLVDEYLPAGNYEREWNASSPAARGNLPSGIYFCRMSAEGGAGNYKSSIKLLLIK